MGSESSTSTNLASTETTRRNFLYIATATVGAVGAAATLIPLIDQMNPDAATIAAGAPVEFDLSKVEPGQQTVVRWRERPDLYHQSHASDFSNPSKPRVAGRAG